MEPHNLNTFKQFLAEYDNSDLQLRRDHQADQKQKQAFNQDSTNFKDQMNNDRAKQAGTQSQDGEPTKGDVLQSPSGKQFTVLARNNKGFRVRELGGDGKEGNLPHGRKYTAVGKTPLNKAIYKVA